MGQKVKILLQQRAVKAELNPELLAQRIHFGRVHIAGPRLHLSNHVFNRI